MDLCLLVISEYLSSDILPSHNQQLLSSSHLSKLIMVSIPFRLMETLSATALLRVSSSPLSPRRGLTPLATADDSSIVWKLKIVVFTQTIWTSYLTLARLNGDRRKAAVETRCQVAHTSEMLHNCLVRA